MQVVNAFIETVIDEHQSIFEGFDLSFELFDFGVIVHGAHRTISQAMKVPTRYPARIIKPALMRARSR